MVSSSRFFDIIRSIGIATRFDIERLQEQINAMNRNFQTQIDELKIYNRKFTDNFANHKKKTEEELRGFVVDVSQIIDALELLLKAAHAEAHISEIRRMTTALKSKRTKALKAIGSISVAKSEGQIDIALREAADG
jgi:hypothetical protein